MYELSALLVESGISDGFSESAPFDLTPTTNGAKHVDCSSNDLEIW